MGWDDISRGSKDYVKLQDGDSADIVFIGEPYTFFQIYGDKTYTRYRKQVDGSNFKFRLRCVVKEDGEYQAKMLQGSWNLACSIKEQIEECGQDAVYKIKRSGKGRDTRYAVIFKSKIPSDQYKNLCAMDFPDLGEDETEEDGMTQLGSSHEDEDQSKDVPF